MARDSSGTHTLPAGNPVVGGSTGTSTWANNTMNDLSTEVTDSLSRSGKGGMLAALKAYDGTLAAPGIAFKDEVGTGLYRAGAGDARFAIGGADIIKILSSGVYAAVHGAITATGAILRGAVADGAAAVGVILDNSVTLANATAKLTSIRNNGTEVAYDDKDGHHYSGGTYGVKAALGATVKGNVADGAAAVGVILDNAVALANAGAKAASIRVNGVEKSYVNKDGKVFGVGLDAGSAVVSNVATPVATTDAANKAYVDARASSHVHLSSSFATTSATAVDVTGLSFAVTSGKKYAIYGQFYVTRDGVANTQFGGAFTTGGAAAIYQQLWYAVNAAAAVQYVKNAAAGLLGAAVLEPTGAAIVSYSGWVNCNSTGTFQMQTAVAAGQTVTFLEGSYLEWNEV